MFVYNGWLSVRETTTEVDDGGLAEVVEYIHNELNRDDFLNIEINFKPINGEYRIWFAGGSNHKPPEFIELYSFLEILIKRAEGSYGLIHFWDDEDPLHGNEFQIYVVRKGKIFHEIDNLLSPCIGMIEDELD
jgi:hypothetical protein